MSSPAKQQRAAPAAQSVRTPREFFEGVFEALIEEVEQNPAFAARLAAKLEGVLQLSTAAKKKRGGEAPSSLLDMDLKAEREAHGEAELRGKLSGYKNAELAAFIRARKLAEGPISKRPKNSLVNIILRASR